MLWAVLSRLMVMVFVSLVCGPLLVGQIFEATVNGTIRDASGAVIPGATVTLQNVQTGVTRTLTTDAQGRYRSPNLEPGEYEIRAEQVGFKTAIRRGIQFSVGQQAAVNLVLEVGEVAERVVVTGDAPLVETRSAAPSTLTGTQEIRDLPLNGRDLIQLALLGTGVTESVYSAANTLVGVGKKLSVGGSRPQANSFLLDGTDINSNTGTTPGSVVGVQLGSDTVREFRVITNPLSAEYGRVSGGVISQVTKSGTNEFHGSAFEFHRNDNLDARNFFNPNPHPPEFKRNQFGLTAGGPVRTDRTFWFGSYEAFLERLGLTSVAVVPTALVREGKLPDPQAPGGIRDVGVNQFIKPYLDLYPLPNGKDFGDGRAEFLSAPSKSSDEHYFMTRMDHRLSESSSFFGRYIFDNADVSSPDAHGATNAVFHTRNHFSTVSFDHVLGASSVNSFRAAFNRSATRELDVFAISFPENLLFQPDVSVGLPSWSVTGLTGFGGTGRRPKVYIQNIYQLGNDFTVHKGRQTLKLGVNYQRIQFNQRNEFQGGGGYGFQTLSDFLQKRPRSFSIQLPGADTVRGMRQNLVGFYVQDEIQAAQGLTVSAGLRYEFITSPTEVNGRLSQLVPFASPDVTPADIKVVDSLFENPSLRNFAPRVGVAWDPLGDGRLSLRGGIGLFYDQILSHYWQLGTVRMPPFRVGISGNSGEFGGPLLFPNWQDMNLQVEPIPSIEGFPDKPNSPYVMRWNFGIDKQIAEGVAVRLGYQGVRGVHLVRHVGVNLEVPTVLPDGRLFFPPTTPLRINPNFSSTRYKLTDGTTNYHGFELSVIKSVSRGLRAQVSYTLSKALDDGASVIGNADIGGDNGVPRFRFGKDRGLSSFDVRNNLAFNFSYEFPGSDLQGLWEWMLNGWQITTITRLGSGHPFSAFVGFTPPGFLAGSADRSFYPDLRSGQTNNPIRGGADNYFDASAFALPAPGFLGNLGRNTLIGPGLANVDFSVLKQTSVGEGKNLEFRAEFFNILNRVNLGLPQLNVFSANGATRSDAGRITGTITTARQIQFGLKFSW